MERYVENLLKVMFLLLLGIGLILLYEKYELGSNILYVVLLFVPTILYAIVSGKLSEFRTLAFEVKFSEVAKQSIKATLDIADSLEMDDAQIVRKQGTEALERQIKDIDLSKPIILTLKRERNRLDREEYSREALLIYTKKLLKYHNFKFVVFLDEKNKIVTYIPPLALIQILNQENLGKEFERLINTGKIQKLPLLYSRMETKVLLPEDTNIEALEYMHAKNLDSFIVADENRKLKGIIRLERIHSRLLLGMK